MWCFGYIYCRYKILQDQIIAFDVHELNYVCVKRYDRRTLKCLFVFRSRDQLALITPLVFCFRTSFPPSFILFNNLTLVSRFHLISLLISLFIYLSCLIWLSYLSPPVSSHPLFTPPSLPQLSAFSFSFSSVCFDCSFLNLDQPNSPQTQCCPHPPPFFFFMPAFSLALFNHGFSFLLVIDCTSFLTLTFLTLFEVLAVQIGSVSQTVRKRPLHLFQSRNCQSV